QPSFFCNEPYGYSGLATCTITQGSSPLDMTPGRHVFEVTGTDRAGNSSTRSIEYVVGSDACVAPPLAPEHLKGWWTLDRTMRDRVTGRDAVPNLDAGTFQPAVVREGWDNSETYGPFNFLSVGDAAALSAGPGLTVAAWVRPRGQHGESASIVNNPSQYRIARYPDGTLRWAVHQTTGFDWVNTGVPIPAYLWSHISGTHHGGVRP